MICFLICSGSSGHMETIPVKSDTNLDGTVGFPDLGILANEWLTTGLPYAPVTKPFPGPTELCCDQTQRNTVLAGQWETIFDIDDGPCLVTNFWVAADFAGKRRKTLPSVVCKFYY